MRNCFFLIACTFLCSLQSFAQKGLSIEKFPVQLQVHESPERLTQIIDSASRASFIPFHAKIYDTIIGVKDALQKDGDLYWHLSAPDLELKVYLELSLNPLDTLYIYDKDGRITETRHRGNHFQSKWISGVYPEEVLLKFHSHTGEAPDMRITNYSLQAKKSSTKTAAGFGDSDFCEVNVNCPEGEAYTDVSKSIVRINIKVRGFEGWCTGTLVNTTAYDYKPYILSAEHCAYSSNVFMSENDPENWEFFFGYEAEGCSNPPSEASVPIRRLIGSSLIARSDDNGGDFGSDFILLELSDSSGFSQLPRPYFAGWNRTNSAPPEGVSIHHPQGDIKKISAFNGASSSAFSTDVEDSHWEVFWIQTSTSHGVTEAGSSGCPLLTDDGLVTGVLTGGLATCNTPNDPDYFGKFSYSWDQNGQQENRKLQPWLDPFNTGFRVIQGSYRGDPIPVDTNDFAVTPIPVNTGILEVRGLGKNQNPANFQIFSLDGRLVYKNEKATLPNAVEQIDVSQFTNGVYILRVEQDETSTVRKIMVIN